MFALLKKNLCLLALIIAFVCLYFAVRIPLLSEPLGYEEGIFAELIVNRPAGPLYSLSGRIDGENIYSYISHPLALYELLRLSGGIWRKFLEYPVYLDDAIITPRLRSITSSYQLIFGCLLLTVALTGNVLKGKWSILLIFTAMLSPLSIKSSAQLQVDNTSGALLCGIAALLFVSSEAFREKGRLKALLLFCGGVLSGLGKHEWSFALLFALAFTGAVCRFLKVEGCRNLYIVAAGLLTANAVSYLLDPVNYRLGLHCILVFSKMSEQSFSTWSFSHWLKLMTTRVPFIYICIVFLIFLVFGVVTNKQRLQCTSYLTAFFGFALFAGYIVSDHNSDLRYFVPSLCVLLVAILSVQTAMAFPLNRWIFILAIVSIWVSTVIFLHGYKPDRNEHLDMITSGSLSSAPETLLFINDGAAWNKPEIDYTNNNVLFEFRKEKIWTIYKKKLVKPTLTEQAESNLK